MTNRELANELQRASETFASSIAKLVDVLRQRPAETTIANPDPIWEAMEAIRRRTSEAATVAIERAKACNDLTDTACKAANRSCEAAERAEKAAEWIVATRGNRE